MYDDQNRPVTRPLAEPIPRAPPAASRDLQWPRCPQGREMSRTSSPGTAQAPSVGSQLPGDRAQIPAKDPAGATDGDRRQCPPGHRAPSGSPSVLLTCSLHLSRKPRIHPEPGSTRQPRRWDEGGRSTQLGRTICSFALAVLMTLLLWKVNFFGLESNISPHIPSTGRRLASREANTDTCQTGGGKRLPPSPPPGPLVRRPPPCSPPGPGSSFTLTRVSGMHTTTQPASVSDALPPPGAGVCLHHRPRAASWATCFPRRALPFPEFS